MHRRQALRRERASSVRARSRFLEALELGLSRDAHGHRQREQSRDDEIVLLSVSTFDHLPLGNPATNRSMKWDRRVAEEVQVDLLRHGVDLLQRDTVVNQDIKQYRHDLVI